MSEGPPLPKPAETRSPPTKTPKQNSGFIGSIAGTVTKAADAVRGISPEQRQVRNAVNQAEKKAGQQVKQLDALQVNVLDAALKDTERSLKGPQISASSRAGKAPVIDSATEQGIEKLRRELQTEIDKSPAKTRK